MRKRDPVTLHSLNIHPTAVVHPGAKLGRGVEVGPFCLVGEHVTIGDGTRLLAHVVVNGRTSLGKDNEVHPFTVIGASSQDKKYRGEVSYVRIGDRNVFREFVTINRGTGEESETVIGSDTHLLAYVHIAHNCRIGNRVVMSNLSQIAGHVTVSDGAILGGMVGVHQFVRIGRMAMLGGHSKIHKDVPPFFMAAGNPASVRGLNNEGLKRNNVPRESVNEIKEAYRMLYFSDDTKSSTIDQLRGASATPEGIELLDFLSNHSARGILNRPTLARLRVAERRPDERTDGVLEES
ncbi:MAG: acyl-ACP--UDP-N-acetylglucosamine O-acyltransferase [Candidatus Eremiobacteraeota bacterium]|nr:acyl-ACP--UDP-N-acetylglucosamine O-acyltransferase [Candidatus Eremiobacteraeota bacterium]MBC5828248.1 acyl-ACP--UDP-N-acetylglucosamine O-acyltransferase [Candidatus Eremiobacteraeota bacterium]